MIIIMIWQNTYNAKHINNPGKGGRERKNFQTVKSLQHKNIKHTFHKPNTNKDKL